MEQRPRLRSAARRRLRRARALRPKVTVLVDARAAGPEDLDRTLTSVRAEPAPDVEIVVAGITESAAGVFARHRDDWRVRPGLRPLAGLVLQVRAGDRLVPGGLAALREAMQPGVTVVVGEVAGALGPTGRALPAAPVENPDLVRLAAPAELGRALWRRAAWRTAVHPRTDTVGAPMWMDPSVSFLGGLTRASRVVSVATPVVRPRERQPEVFGAMLDPTPELPRWRVMQHESLRTLAGSASRLRHSWAVSTLAEAERFLDATERLDDAGWNDLRRVVTAVVGLLDEQARPRLLQHLEVEARVKVWLAAQGRREDLERFVVDRRRASGQYPTEVAGDGAGSEVRAVLPVPDDVPDWLLRLGEPATPLVASLRATRAVGEGEDRALELDVWAWHHQVSLTEPAADPAAVRVELVRPHGGKDGTDPERLELEVEPFATPAATRFAGRRFQRVDAAGLRCRVPVAAVGRGPWHLHVTLRTAAGERAGVVAHCDTGDARLEPTPIDDHHALKVSVDPLTPVRLEVVGGRAARVRGRLRVESVALEDDHLVVTGSRAKSEVTVALAGQDVEVSAAAAPEDGRWEVRLELAADPWQLGRRPLASGRYALTVDGKAPRLASGLRGGLPVVGVGATHRLQVRRAASGRVDVHLSAPLTDDELGPYRQTEAQQRYASVTEPLDEDLVYFQSYTGAWATDSPLAICEELQRRRPDLDLVWGVADRSAWHPEGTRAVLWRSREWYDVLARAGHVVTNIEMEPWFRRRDGQEVVQSFHGYPSKTMGIVLWRAKNFTDSRVAQQLARTSGNWSVLLTPDPAMDVHYREQYRYQGRIVSEGYPRDDLLVSARAEQVRAETRERLGIAGDTTAVLYAPTWRDDQATNFRAATFSTELDLAAAARALGEDHVLLVRGHRFHARAKAPVGRHHARVVDVTGYPEVNHLILAADAAVLDYSSLRFDFALTGRPMVFLVPDLDRYTGGVRGFLYDFEPTAPGPHVATTAEVVAALRDLDATAATHREAYEAFNRAYNSRHDGQAAARVVDAVWGRPGA